MTGVSFVVPVHNGAAFIRDTLEAIMAQADGRPLEVIVVDDASRDGSADALQELARRMPLRVIAGAGRGAAAAINTGVRAARMPIICQVDQDVVVTAGWMRALTAALDDPAVAAAQGYYVTHAGASLCARAMSLDLEQRYAAIDGRETDQVCTGNSAYRAEALRQVGLFDDTFGYGYDNDMSYRLRAAGHRLVFCREAQSVHRWREGLAGYLVQQYGFGYGRVDLVVKHGRVRGDTVSRGGMMAHPLLMGIALAALVAALIMAAVGGPWRALTWGSLVLLAALTLERSAAGISAAWRFRDRAALVFPALHLARDLAWVTAIAVWSGRRAFGRPPKPSHSMYPRPALTPNSHEGGGTSRIVDEPGGARGILCLIPAHNEAVNLPAVIAELRASRPDLDILVVNDGSTDGTEVLLRQLAVRWLHFPERMGVGSAMRAGLRYATRLGYRVVARVDGDGQHRAEDIDRLLAPILDGTADVVLGSRYTGRTSKRSAVTLLAQTMLAVFLSALTRRRVTDPTSGFCAVGPSALHLLAEHYPSGYGEPELRLLLSDHTLRVVEVPVRARGRFGGRTSLTAWRVTATGARVALAMLLVELRGRMGRSTGD